MKFSVDNQNTQRVKRRKIPAYRRQIGMVFQDHKLLYDRPVFDNVALPLIIAGVIPFALIGVTVGLLTTGQPFGFLALLGLMSLAGMMTKNAIVLLDEINIQKESGKSDYQAVMDAAVSRLRPVMLAAGTTVLGVAPLLQDVFWVAMAVTIMFGLAFGSILTMVLLPVLYACFFPVATRD